MLLSKPISVFLFAILALAVSACTSIGLNDLQPPAVSLSNIRPADNMTFFEQRYDVALRVQNPNNVDLPISGLNYKVILNNREFARGVSRNQTTIPALGEKVIHVTVASGAFDWFKQINQLQSKPDLKPSYKVEGTLFLQNGINKGLSFSQSGSFDVE